jgi:hypothetical protein
VILTRFVIVASLVMLVTLSRSLGEVEFEGEEYDED